MNTETSYMSQHIHGMDAFRADVSRLRNMGALFIAEDVLLIKFSPSGPLSESIIIPTTEEVKEYGSKMARRPTGPVAGKTIDEVLTGVRHIAEEVFPRGFQYAAVVTPGARLDEIDAYDDFKRAIKNMNVVTDERPYPGTYL